MAGIRSAAVTVGIINGAWGIVAGLYWRSLFQTPLMSSGINMVLPATDVVISVVGLFLILVSLVCLVGPSNLLYASAVVSIAMVGAEFVTGVSFDTTGLIVSLFLMAATVVLDVAAATRKQYVSEENHPLNLPVFG